MRYLPVTEIAKKWIVSERSNKRKEQNCIGQTQRRLRLIVRQMQEAEFVTEKLKEKNR